VRIAESSAKLPHHVLRDAVGYATRYPINGSSVGGGNSRRKLVLRHVHSRLMFMWRLSLWPLPGGGYCCLSPIAVISRCYFLILNKVVTSKLHPWQIDQLSSG